MSAKLAIDVPFGTSTDTNQSLVSMASVRHTDYVSATTASIGVALQSPPTGYIQPTPVNVTPGSGACPVDAVNPGNYVCTVNVQLPPGSDSVKLTTYSAANATGSVLSQQVQTLTVVAGISNAFSLTLDASPGGMNLTATSFCQSGAVGAAVTSAQTPVTFSVQALDPKGSVIHAPGLPTIKLNSLTGNGVIAGTTGNVNYSIDQTAQTFTLTPSAANAVVAIAVSLVPANSNGGSDGLSTIATQSFTMYGAASEGAGLVAATESHGAIDLHRLALGGSGGPDVFTTVGSVPITTSSNQAGISNVDHPSSIAFDSTGDLLVANAGSSNSTDPGSFACIPAGAVTQSSPVSTTVSQTLLGPTGIGYNSMDGSVALVGGPVAAPDQFSLFTLQGPYASKTAFVHGSGVGSTAVTGLPTLGNSAFAFAVTSGTPKSPHGTGSSLIYVTDASNTYFFTSAAIDDPTGLAFDTANGQLVIGDSSPFEETVNFYTVGQTSGALVKTIDLTNAASPITPGIVATSADGHIAVGGSGGLVGDPEIQVFDNTSARMPVGGPIPFNGTTTSCGTTYNFDVTNGGTAVLGGLTWLSNTKLLASLSTGLTSQQGLYVFDISSMAVPSGYDDFTCAPFATAPKQTGFIQTANPPQATAYKP